MKEKTIKGVLNRVWLIIAKFFSKVKNYFINTFKSPKKTFYLLLELLLLISLGVFIASWYYGGFFNVSTDDIIQYYPYVAGLFDKIKAGTLSFYDVNLFGGVSFFSGVYYLPFDSFTLLAFLFSYVMPSEVAYSLFNFMKVVTGASVLYYVLIRRNFKTTTAFFTSLILFLGGITETYFVFPVYISVLLYAPLAMLVVDLVVDKKGYFYFLLPLLCVLLVLVDFYIAYMVIAFMCFYFFISLGLNGAVSLVGSKCFLFNKEFYKRFLTFMVFIFMGVFASCFWLMPSVLYVLNQSSRSFDGFTDPSLWLFMERLNGVNKVAWDHYFTLLISFFMPNEPHRLLLNYGTDYIRNHASFYMTSGGAIFLTSFFLINRKKENEFKFWVILFNIMYMMPLFACIFNFNTIPYSRWVFIPYMINLLAMAYGMDNLDLGIAKRKWYKLIPLAVMLGAISMYAFVLKKAPDLFMHYKRSDEFFYYILIPSLIIAILYALIMLYSFVADFIPKCRFNGLKLIYGVIIIELIFAGIIMFTYIDNTSKSYFTNKNTLVEMKKELYEYGYNDYDGYRINIDANAAKSFLNANILVGNVNFGRLFQSFYNTPLETSVNDLFNEGTASWNKTINGVYNMLSGAYFNMKYVVTWGSTAMPKQYHEVYTDKAGYKYYVLEDLPNFIVYDEVVSTRISSKSLVEKLEVFLNHGYVPYSKFTTKEALEETTFNNKKEYNTALETFNNYQALLDSNVTIVAYDTAKSSNVSDSVKLRLVTTTSQKSGYQAFEILGYEAKEGRDLLHVYINNQNVRRNSYEDIFVVDDKVDIDNDISLHSHHLHYDLGYLDGTWTPKYIYVKLNNDTNTSIVATNFSSKYYDNFIAKQNVYQNRSYTLNGSKMHIGFTTNDSSKALIVKTAYTYSDEWKCLDERYKTINIDGGFLGIVVPKGINNVDINLIFKPLGFETGWKISFVSAIIYVIVLTSTVTFRKRRRFLDEKNIINRSLL